MDASLYDAWRDTTYSRTRGALRVDLFWSGEGDHGDYRPQDPTDCPRLRFSCSIDDALPRTRHERRTYHDSLIGVHRDPGTVGWLEQVSVCLNVPTCTPACVLDGIMDALLLAVGTSCLDQDARPWFLRKYTVPSSLWPLINQTPSALSTFVEPYCDFDARCNRVMEDVAAMLSAASPTALASLTPTHWADLTRLRHPTLIPAVLAAVGRLPEIDVTADLPADAPSVALDVAPDAGPADSIRRPGGRTV